MVIGIVDTNEQSRTIFTSRPFQAGEATPKDFARHSPRRAGFGQAERAVRQEATAWQAQKVLGRKSPSSNTQAPKNTQSPNFKPPRNRDWRLGFGTSLEF